MDIRTFKPQLVVIGLMALTSLAVGYSVDVRITDQAGIKVYLPDRVGEWTGDELRYCLEPTCQKEFLVSALKDREVCPLCGGPLSSMSKSEKDILPPDTILLKKQYTHPGGDRIFASVVLSGAERSSIHRPQMCLVGQGNEILDSKVVEVPLEGRAPLKVMDLEILRKIRTRDGRLVTYPSYYAYWFVGKGRETPYHIHRMIWMAVDRILFNVSHRWAYITVSGFREEGSDAYQKTMTAFLRDLYPQMLPE